MEERVPALLRHAGGQEGGLLDGRVDGVEGASHQAVDRVASMASTGHRDVEPWIVVGPVVINHVFLYQITHTRCVINQSQDTGAATHHNKQKKLKAASARE